MSLEKSDVDNNFDEITCSNTALDDIINNNIEFNLDVKSDPKDSSSVSDFEDMDILSISDEQNDKENIEQNDKQNDKQNIDQYIEENKDDVKVEYQNDDIEIPTVQAKEPKKKELPKSLLNAKKKYEEMLEKKNKNGKKMVNSKEEPKKVSVIKQQPPNTRRVLVAGKVKYLPIKNSDTQNSEPDKTDISSKETPRPDEIDTREVIITDTVEIDEVPVEKIKIQKLQKPSKVSDSDKKSKYGGRRIPARYAKKIESDIKKQAVKNAKNINDLRRVKTMQDIIPDPSIDLNKASFIELRKIRTEQRKAENFQKQKELQNKRETAIEEIMKNDKLSKFAKLVAIKNLSVTSRHKKAFENDHNSQITSV